MAAGVLLVMALAAAASARADEAPGRVIAIGGAVTEIVYRLGRGQALVAVDSTSTYPEAATALPDVGYMRQLAAEPIISLDPDHVIAAADAGPAVVFEQLRDAGVAVTRVPGSHTPEGITAKVRAVAAALGVEERGRQLVMVLGEQFAGLRERLAAVEHRPRALVLIAAGAGNLMAAGRNTSAAGILRLAAARNAVDGYAGYRPLAAEAVIAAAPEWLVLTRSAMQALGGPDGVGAHPGLGATPAAEAGHIVAMDALTLLGFGPRTPEVASRLAARLHPQLSGPEGE